MPYRLVLAAWLLIVPLARAASLSSGLSPQEIGQAVEALGFMGTTRLLRSAEAYDTWPGIKFGIEVTAGPTRELASTGNRDGSVPQVNILPRFILAKGLFAGFEAIFSTLPVGNHPGMTATGGALKWSFHNERDGWFSLAAFAAYTHVTAYRADYTGDNWEFGLLLSKDYVRIKPYFGAGALLARGEVRPALARSAIVGATRTTLHAFLGVEWELPINVGFQIDVVNLTPNFTLFFAQKF